MYLSYCSTITTASLALAIEEALRTDLFTIAPSQSLRVQKNVTGVLPQTGK
jgi:hypothetical protein